MTAPVPDFLERMNAVFASERSNQFLLVGNIHDLVDARSLDTKESFLPMVSFLLQRLGSKGHTPIRYDIGQGIRFTKPQDHKACRKAFGKGEADREALFDSLIRSRSLSQTFLLNYHQFLL